MLLNDPTRSYYPPTTVAPPSTPTPSPSPATVSTHPLVPNFLCSNVRIRNLILDQLHIRNLVSTGYTAEDTGGYRIRD